VAKSLDIEDILARIKHLIRDLETVRNQTSSQLFSPEQRARHKEFLETPGSMEIIMQFKELLDDLRQIVWLHLEVVVAGSIGEPQTRDRLLQRAAEILCALSVHSALPKQHFAAATGSYLDRVMELVESRMAAKQPRNRQSLPESTASALEVEHPSRPADRKSRTGGK
jgi:hypothetical protein